MPSLAAASAAPSLMPRSDDPVSWTIDRSAFTEAATADQPAPVLPRPIPPTQDTAASSPPRKRVRRQPRLRIDRLLMLGAGGVVAIVLIFWVIGRVLAGIAGVFSHFGAPKLEGTPVTVSLDRPVFTLPKPAPEAATPEDQTRGQLTDERAQATIKTWLDIKRRAMGKDREIDALGEILVAPALASLENLAIDAEASGWYWEYEHEVKDVVIERAPEGTADRAADNQATSADETGTTTEATSTRIPLADRGAAPIAIVSATVIERGTLFEDNSEVRQTNDTLRVQYELEQRDDRWYVRDWQAEAE
ncbi:MAG: DUF4101 domain-containing protein [Coleofasciculaceae cyanobacterium RL_1_1]|nr:DUF4101 domain-containing protein [Coleofasciculaceae cyanobacterium RL_1_1]